MMHSMPYVKDRPPAATLHGAEDVAAVMRSGSRFLITGHRGADGDAVGAALGLALLLDAMGKTSVVYSSEPYPRQFRFLTRADRVAVAIDPNERFDATLVVDCAVRELLGAGVPNDGRQGTLCVIDHHLTQTAYGDINYLNPEAAAVGEMIYEIAAALQLPITKPLAEALYTSILTDTGSFHYSSTGPRTFRIAAELIEAGVEPWHMAEKIYETVPWARFELLRLMLNTIEVGCDGRYAMVVVTHDMFEKTGATREMTDGIINFARSIEGVEVAASFSQLEPGNPRAPGFQVSLRSRGSVNVARVAEGFGGGGHHNAAGGIANGDLASARRTVIDSVRSVLAETAS